MIVSFVQTKGGTGKSTAAAGVAFSQAFADAFDAIVLVELDSQKTLSRWWETRQAHERDNQKVHFINLSDAGRETLHASFEGLESKFDGMVLDVPGESVGRFHTQFACAISDLVVIPMRTSTNDEEAFEGNLLPIIKETIKADAEQEGAFHVLPSFVHPQTKIASIAEYFTDILPDPIKTLPARLPVRGVFENFNRQGCTLKEYAEIVKTNSRLHKQAENAIDDIEDIAHHILDAGRG